MATKEEWDAIVGRLRREREEGTDPRRSPYLRDLYDAALSDGPRFLASFQRTLGDDRIHDLIGDLLVEKLDKIIAADTLSPRAFFCTSLQNRAKTWVRRKDAAVVESPPDSSRVSPSDKTEEERRAFVLDARDALAALSERDRNIVVAAALGEERETIARELKTSRANVDQIVSRLQKHFRGEQS